MADAFNLTAQLNLRGPSNIKTVVADIRRQIGTVNADLKFKIDPTTTRNLAQLNSTLRNFNSTLNSTQTSATNAARAISSLGRAVNGINIKNLPQQINSAANAVGKLSSASASNTKALQTASTEMQEFGKQAYLAVRRFAAFTGVTGVIFSVTSAIQKGVDAFIEYDRQFVKLQQVTGESAAGLQNLSKTITSLATGLGVASSDITEVASTLAQAGLSARDTERALKALALSSLAPSFDDMNETVEGSIALMRQFGISAGQLEGALGSVNAVAAKFAVEASDIITAIQRTGGVFATASKGVSEGTDALNEFVAVFTSVRATTRESAETIATGLRTIFTRIQRGSTIEALKEYGVNLTDLDGKFVGAYKAVELLSQGLNKLDPRDLSFSNIVEELGGFRQIGKVIPLIQQFATAQEALKVAQRGQGSLALDAAKAQDSLSNKITKVKEEFFALFREIGNSDGFQTLIRGALDLSSALIKIADSIKGVLPALGIFAAFKGVSALTQFTSGFIGAAKVRQKSDGGPIRKFASGGLVPGQGNSDTVPAMLTPGEFVIRKKAVSAIGSQHLYKMNKYASGGTVKQLKQMSKGSRYIANKQVEVNAQYGRIVNDSDFVVDPGITRVPIQLSQSDFKRLKKAAMAPSGSDTKYLPGGIPYYQKTVWPDVFEDIAKRKAGTKWKRTAVTGKFGGASSPVDLYLENESELSVGEVKFTGENNHVSDPHILSKLLRFKLLNNDLSGFTKKPKDLINVKPIKVYQPANKDQFLQYFKAQSQSSAKKTRSRYSYGGSVDAPLVDDILENAKGSLLPSKVALEKLIQTGYGALDFDRTLKRTTGDAAYARAKTTQEKDAVLSRYFRDRSARLSDAKNSRLTQFGKALQEAIKNKQIDPKNLSIISKSSRVPGLAEHINELFGIPASNMIFTSGGSKEPALEAMRTKGPRANRVFKNLGGFIQRLSGGGGVKDLASMIPSEILAEAKKYGIDVPFATRDILRKRKSLSSTDSLVKQGLLEKLSQARSAASDRAQSDSQIAARRKIAVVGITGDRTEQEILTPGFTDKQSGQSVRGVPATLQSGALPPSLAKRVQALIRGRIENLVRDVGIQIARSAGTNAITDKKAIRNIASKDIEDIAGSIFEKALGAAGGNYDPLSKAIDFPSGLNQQISSLLGVDSGVMTDATYNATSAAAKRKVAKGQFDRGRLEARSRFGRSQFALGGTVQKFASGGEAQTPQLYTRGSLTYSIDDMKNAAQRNGMTLEQLKALLEERQDNDWKDFVIPYYDLEKRFGLTTYKPQDTNLFQKVMAAKIDKEDRIETWKQKQGLATRDYEGRSERQKGFLSARKQRRGFAVGGSVGKGLGSKIYDLQKGTGLSDREFNELVYFAKTNDFNEQQFKNYLSSHLQNKQRKQALGTDTEALRRSLLGGTATTSSQMLLAQQLMGAPDAKWNPKYDKARFAVGGSVEDTVPALLTPGEFVINKKAAQRIGTGKLHQLNRADKIQGFNKGGVVQRFAKGGQAYSQNVARSADISIKQANPLQGLGLLFGNIEKMSQNLPASAGLVKNLDKTLGQLGKTFGNVSQKSGVTIQQLRKAIEADLAKAYAANESASKIDKLKKALQTLNDVQDTATNKLADSRSSRISLTKDRISNAIDRTPILGSVSRIGKSLGGERGYYMSMGLGMLAGQGENFFGKENGRRTNTGMIARTGANNAFTSSGLEAGATTLSSGLATASSLAMIPGVGPFAAALVGGVTVIKAWTSAVEAGKKAAEEFANQQRENKMIDLQDQLDKAFANYQTNPNSTNSLNTATIAANQASVNRSDTSSDVQRRQRELFDTRWWYSLRPEMKSEDVTAIAKENAQKAESGADISRQILERKVASGSSVADLTKLPEFEKLAQSIATADIEYQKAIANTALQNVLAEQNNKTLSEEEQKRLRNAETVAYNTAVNKAFNSEQLKAIEKSRKIAEAFDEINKKGRDLAASFDRIVDSFNQALGRATYELEQMDKLSEGRSAALQGNASVLSVSSRDSNILRNPKAYSEAEKQAAIDRSSSLFGKDKKLVQEMLGVNAKDFARSMTQAVEKDLKGVKIGEGNANLSLEDAASTARKNLASQLAGAPDDVRNQILDKFDKIVESVDEDKDLKGQGPQEKVNALINRIEGQLGGAAIEGGEKIQQMALAMLDFKNGALNEFINATNKAAEAQLRAQKAAFDAEDIIVKGRDNLNSVLGRSGPTPVDIKARQDARIAQLSGGPTDPIQIRENIQNDIKAQSAKQKELQQNTDPGKEKQLVQDISDLSIKIKKGQEALDQLANSTEVASAALNKIQEIQQAMEGQGDFLDKLATATPEEAEKLGQAFMRLQNNLNGGINTIRNSREAQIAYIKTLRETGNPMMAQRASMGVLAQQRAETMSLFKELIPVFQAQNKSPEQIAEMGARLRQGTYTESGMFNNPMLAPLAKQQVDFTRDPMSDPRIAANAALYNQAINKQAEARFQQGALEVYDAGLIMQDATTRFDTAVIRLQTYLENIRSGERPATVAVPKAKGGPIYASSGTLVNFEPKGTDTVPAMLTPGEFVVNANATSQHLPLLKSINNGEDISGYSKGGVVYFADGGAVSARDKARQARKEAYQKQQAARRQAFLGRMRPEVAEGFKTDSEKGARTGFMSLTDNTGKFNTEAKIIGEDNKTYTVQTKDGATGKVPKTRLSKRSLQDIQTNSEILKQESLERRSLMTMNNRTPEQQSRYEELLNKYKQDNPEKAKAREAAVERAATEASDKRNRAAGIEEPRIAINEVNGIREKIGQARRYIQQEIEAWKKRGATDEEALRWSISNFETAELEGDNTDPLPGGISRPKQGTLTGLKRPSGLDLSNGGWNDLVDWNRDGKLDDFNDIPNEMAIVTSILEKNRGVSAILNNPDGKFYNPRDMVDLAMYGEQKEYWEKQKQASAAKARQSVKASVDQDKLQASRDKRLGLDKNIRDGIGSQNRSATEAADPKLQNQLRQDAIANKFTFESNRGKTTAVPSNIDTKNKTITFAKIDPKTGLPLTDKDGNKIYTRPVPFSELTPQSLDNALSLGPIDMDQSRFKDQGGYDAYKKEYDKQQSEARSLRDRLRTNQESSVLAPTSGMSLDDVAKMQADQERPSRLRATMDAMPTPEVSIRTEDTATESIPNYQKNVPPVADTMSGPRSSSKQPSRLEARTGEVENTKTNLLSDAITQIFDSPVVAKNTSVLPNNLRDRPMGIGAYKSGLGPYSTNTPSATTQANWEDQNEQFGAAREGLRASVTAGLGQRASAAAVTGTIDAATQMATTGEINPRTLAISAGGSFIQPGGSSKKAADVVRSVDDKLITGITGMTPDGYHAAQRTRSGALKSDVKARAANRKAEQWIDDTSKEFFRKPGEQTTRNYGFSGYSPDISTPQSKYPSYTASLKQIDEMRKPGGANSIDIDENARWKFGDEDLQLGTSINRNSSAMDTIDPLKVNAAEAMARQAEKPQVSLVKPRNIEISDEANDVLSFMNDMKASERSTTKADISTNIPINKAQQETVVRSSAKPVTTTPIKTKRQNSNVRLSDMQNLSDSAQKYLSSMPQTQRDAFEALSFNVNKNKQEIFLRDIIEKAAGIVYASDGGLISESQRNIIDKIIKSRSSSYGYSGTMSLGLSLLNAANISGDINSNKFDKDKTKKTLISLVENNELRKQQLRKNDINTKNKPKKYSVGGIVYANNGALIEAQNQGSDTVPAMLTPGEFVINRESAQKHMPVLHAINNGHYNRGGMIEYLNNGGVVGPKYYANGGINPVEAARQMSANRGANGVNTSGNSSGTNSAIQQEPEWLSKLDETVNGIKESLGGMYSNLNNVANQLTNVAQELPREMSITSNVNKNVNVNGIAGEWNKYQGDVLKMAGEQASKTIQDDKVKLAKWSEGAIPVIG